MTIAEVAEALHVSRKVAYAMVHEGNLPVVNLAPPYQRPRYRVDREDLIAFVSRRKANLGAVRTSRRAAAATVPNYIGI